jgi:hypothetical protein
MTRSTKTSDLHDAIMGAMAVAPGILLPPRWTVILEAARQVLGDQKGVKFAALALQSVGVCVGVM